MTARILVTGSRRFGDADLALTALSEARWKFGPFFVVVHGDAEGADRLLAEMAQARGLLPEPHAADWTGPCRSTCQAGHRRKRWNGTEYCPDAGNYRNQLMVDLGADLVIAFPVGRSDETRDCMRRAKAVGIPVREYERGGVA